MWLDVIHYGYDLVQYVCDGRNLVIFLASSSPHIVFTILMAAGNIKVSAMLCGFIFLAMRYLTSREAFRARSLAVTAFLKYYTCCLFGRQIYFRKKRLVCSLCGVSKCLLSLFGFILSADRTLLHSRHFGFSS